MKKVFIFTLQCLIWSCLQSQNITVNNIVGEYQYPAIDKIKENENVLFIYNGTAFYYPHCTIDENFRCDIREGRYELSDSIIRVFKDSLSLDILYEFKILDSLNLEVLYSFNEKVMKGAFFHRNSSFFKFENEKDFIPHPWFISPSPWTIKTYGDRKNEDEEYKCTYYDITAEKPAGMNFFRHFDYYYKVDSVKILPKSIYKQNTSIVIDKDEP